MANGLSFESALKDAQDKGYVEADESLDAMWRLTNPLI
jgi:homoserine dehydrogenase